MLMTTIGLLRVPLDLSLMGILLVENLLPALSVSVVNIDACIPSVKSCVVICIQCSLDYPTPLKPRLVQIIKKSEQIDKNSYKKSSETVVNLPISYS